MSAASNYLELKVLDHVLGVTAYTAPTNRFLGLFTANTGLETNAPTAEVSGGSYARQAIAFSAAVAGASNSSATVTFPAATANWGTITHVAVMDGDTEGAGNVLFYGAVTTAKLSTTGVTAGTYTTATVTVDAKGRITSASSGSSGGVTSLNGQTGAITDTSYGAIGSYVIAASTTAVGAAGNTVAGSSLNYQNHPTAIMNMGYINYYEGQNLAGNIWTDSTTCGLSGTWRAMTKTVSANRFGLYVRIS